jgi:hypothetical protein
VKWARNPTLEVRLNLRCCAASRRADFFVIAVTFAAIVVCGHRDCWSAELPPAAPELFVSPCGRGDVGMSSDVDLAPAKIGDKGNVYSLVPLGHGKVVAVHEDGSVSLEYARPGRYGEDEHGHYIELGGGEPGEFVTMHCRARPETLADGTRRFTVMLPAAF